MRTNISMASVILYALSYGAYTYLAHGDLLPHDYFGAILAWKDGMTAFIFSVLIWMALSRFPAGFEKAWLQTGALFATVVLWWKPLYSLNLLHELSLNYIIGLNFATALLSFIFFYHAIKHKMHEFDE